MAAAYQIQMKISALVYKYSMALETFLITSLSFLSFSLMDSPIDWNVVEDQYDGVAIDLNYTYVFEESDDEEQGEHELEHIQAGRGVPGSGHNGRDGADQGDAGRGVTGRAMPGSGGGRRGHARAGTSQVDPGLGRGRGEAVSSQGRGRLGSGRDGAGQDDACRGGTGRAMRGRGGGGSGHGRGGTEQDGSGHGRGHGEAVRGRGRGRLGLAGRGRGTITWHQTTTFTPPISSGRSRGRLGLAGRGRGRLGLAGHGTGRGRTLDLNTMANVDDADENENGDNGAGGQGNQGHVKKEEKLRVYGMLLERTSVGRLKRGVAKEVSSISHMPLRTVQNIWTKGKRAGSILGVMTKKPKNCGRKRIAFDPEAIKEIEPKYKTTLQDLANALGMSRSTLHRRLKEGKLRRHTNARSISYSTFAAAQPYVGRVQK